MASTNKTPNYNLSQFQPTDEPQRVDWNSDMTKIDTAIKANATNIGLLKGQIASDPIAGFDCNIRDPNFRYVKFYAGLNAPSADICVMIHIPYSEHWIYQEVHTMDWRGHSVYSRFLNNGGEWPAWTEKTV